jgi:dTMP kinase
MIESFNAFAIGNCVPDISFVLDVDASTAESRMNKPRKADRMEQQPAEFYERVREGYRELAAREPKRVVLIDGSRKVDAIENEIWKHLCRRFSKLTTKE